MTGAARRTRLTRRGVLVLAAAVVTLVGLVILVVGPTAGGSTAGGSSGSSSGSSIGSSVVRADGTTASATGAASARKRSSSGRGTLRTVTIAGTTSHFVARPAIVWSPPALRTQPGLRLPVLELLIGVPGAPDNWLVRGDLVRRMTAVAARHDGRAPIVVVVDENGMYGTDTECVTTNNGDVDRYLAVDVPAWIHRHLPVLPGRRYLAVGGLSEGGTCSLMLALRHPSVWATFDDISGLARATVGSHDDRPLTIAQLFGGSATAYDAHDPTVLLRRHRYPTTGGELFYGRQDSAVARDVQTLRPLLVGSGLPARVRTSSGGHTWPVFGAGLSSFVSSWHPGL